MSDVPEYSVQITHANDALSDLEPSWRTAVFSAEDGIGPMDSLHQAGDALVAVAEFGEDGMIVHGSGVMVAPGMLLTATHVLDVFARDGTGPVFCTFLPTGMRAWLPIDVITIAGPSAFYHDRKVFSDLSLVSCTLNSDAHADQPLMLAPMEVALPLIGDRLWAVGFRHQHIGDGGTYVAPLVSSGLVTAAYPNGRGERMASPCFEVEMEAVGGMSGGAVVNSKGLLVGIVSSSFDGAPTYVTLIWDALRMDVTPPIAKFSARETVSLFGAKARNLAKIKGDVSRDPFGEVTFRMTEAEATLIAEANARDKVEPGRSRALNDEQLEAFEEEWNSELEDAASRGAIDYLARSSLGRMRAFVAMSGAPATCLEALTAFTVEDFDGVEDFDVTFTERMADGSLELECLFELRRVIWNLDVSLAQYRANQAAFDAHFFIVESDEERVVLGLTQRCVFKGVIDFDEASEAFDDAVILSTAVKCPRVARKKA